MLKNLKTKKNVTILGGGISGAATAFYLSKLREESESDFDITVIDAKPEVGGVIQSLRRDDLLMECGPDCFSAENGTVEDLCEKLGLENEVIGIQPEHKQIYLWSQGELFPIPEGFHLVAPAHPKVLLQLPFISWPGKIRMACEIFIPKKRKNGDESIGNFMKRRFGKEIVEKIGQPLLGSIFGGNIDWISLQATLPRFRNMEDAHGSVTRALWAMKKPSKSAPQVKAKPSKGMFLTLKGGVQQLATTIVEKTPEVEWLFSNQVTKVDHKDGWNIHLQSGEVHQADVLCSALPAATTAAIVREVAPELAEDLESIPTKSILTVNMSFRPDEIGPLPQGSGFVCAEEDNVVVTGCSFSTQKFEGLSGNDRVLIRAFVGNKGSKQYENAPDEQIVAAVLDNLKEVLKIKNAPSSFHVARYQSTMPQYLIGHMEKIARLERRSAQLPGLFLAGNSYRGAGVSACVQQGRATAERISILMKKIVSESIEVFS